MRSNLLSLFVVLVTVVFAACGGDTAGNTSTCATDTDCPLGEVCQVNDKVCIKAACDFCTAEQICYKPTPDAAGSCSAPECGSDADCSEGVCRKGQCSTGGCTANTDCNEGEVCNLAGQCVESDGTCASDMDCPSGEVCKDDACAPGCSADEDCEDGQYCDAERTCSEGCRDSTECPSGQVCSDGDCACNETSCPDGKVCLETGNCGDPTSCDQVTCGDGEACDPSTLMCVAACTADSCMPNEICNTATGLCEVNNCPGEDPTQCMGNAQRPTWDPIKCFCAECLSDADCDQALGETCNSAGSCFACQTACDPNMPGTCQGGTPYCINNCCVECVGAADCGPGQLCLDGACGDPPNCMVDPTVCPSGYTCMNGQCQAPQGGACDANDPTSCPQGTFCDPTTQMCVGAGGGFGCGLCNADCTCDGGLTCNGFLCEGCDTLTQNCPNGEFCLPLDFNNPQYGVCFPI